MVYVNDRPVLRTAARGRIRNLRMEQGVLGLELPPSGSAPRERSWLELPGVVAGAVTDVALDGAAVADLVIADGFDGARVFIPDRTDRAELVVTWRS